MSRLIGPDGRPHLLYGKAAVLEPDGSVAWEEEDFTPNTLVDEGEKDVLDVYLLEVAHKTKYLGLINQSTPAETATMASLTESKTPGTDGYARQQITSANWSTPTLNAGDYQTTAAEKTFGAITGSQLTATHVILTTTSTGTGGLFLLYVPLSATTNVAVGQTFKYTLTSKVQ